MSKINDVKLHNGFTISSSLKTRQDANPDYCPFQFYRKVSDIRCTKSQKLNDSRLVLQLSLPNPLKLGVKLSLKM